MVRGPTTCCRREPGSWPPGAPWPLAAPWLGRAPRPIAALVGWLGVGLLVAGLVVIGPMTEYPGLAALLPTLGAAGIIASGGRAGSPGRSCFPSLHSAGSVGSPIRCISGTGRFSSSRPWLLGWQPPSRSRRGRPLPSARSRPPGRDPGCAHVAAGGGAVPPRSALAGSPVARWPRAGVRIDGRGGARDRRRLDDDGRRRRNGHRSGRVRRRVGPVPAAPSLTPSPTPSPTAIVSPGSYAPRPSATATPAPTRRRRRARPRSLDQVHGSTVPCRAI